MWIQLLKRFGILNNVSINVLSEGKKKNLISTKPLAFSKMIWIFHDVFRMSEWKPYFREHIFINHVGPWTIILICVKQSTTRFDPFLWMRMTNIETKNPRRPNSSLQFKPTLPLSKKVLHNVSSISNFFLFYTVAISALWLRILTHTVKSPGENHGHLRTYITPNEKHFGSI